jgi:hypothetical protein
VKDQNNEYGEDIEERLAFLHGEMPGQQGRNTPGTSLSRVDRECMIYMTSKDARR